MLVVISDLHFVDGTAGEHNLPTSAFTSVFLSSIVSLAKQNEATNLRLLLLGDIPDLIRSQQWYLEAPEDRPWGSNGLADIPTPRPGSRTEQRCLDILGRFPADGRRDSVPENTILYKNWYTFEFFRHFRQVIWHRLGRKIPVELIYIVGNHDRPCNLYPSVRDELQKILGLTITEQTIQRAPDGNWWYSYDFFDAEHGVYARHGHQFDSTNYGGGKDFTRLDHLQVPIGDVISTEFAVNLPRTLESLKDKYPSVSDRLVENLKDIDNVRPLENIMEWFHNQIEQESSQEVRQALDETFDRVLSDFLDIEFVQNWRSPDTYWDEFLRLISSRWLQWVPNTILGLTNTANLLPRVLPIVKRLQGDTNEAVDPYTAAAYHEPSWRQRSPIRYILYGHTHRALLRPLDVLDGREIIHLNTGTWREQIDRTIPLDESANFVKLKQMTYAVFYNKDEDKSGKEPGTVSFDMWTGHKKKYYGGDG